MAEPPDDTHLSNPFTLQQPLSNAPRRKARLHYPLFALLLSLLLAFAFVAPTHAHVLPASIEQRNASDATAALQARAALKQSLQQAIDSYAAQTRSSSSFDAQLDSLLESIVAPRSAAVALAKRQAPEPGTCTEKKKEETSSGLKVVYGILVPVLVVLSGIFAGLTLAYFSLDETQLQVLLTTGTPEQKRAAEKILPVRKDGHLLLTTLLIANMISNEFCPTIFEKLVSGVTAVVLSIVLIVIFAELIPQSVCSRYGLQVGAFMAPVTRLVMFILWPVAWPVSRVLHYALGPHQGTVYRRAELKELVNMHAATKGRGDLNNDTIVIVGGALDLQEKVAKQAMTPIDDVFMLPYTAKLDYATLEQVVRSGHSRIPIYAEVEVPVSKNGNSGACTPSKKSIPLAISAFVRKASFAGGSDSTHVEPSSEGSAPHAEGSVLETVVRKKIIGMLLVKQTVLLDPEDATPIADLIINALPTVPADEPLLNVLNAFQEGRSHMAIVSSRPRKMGVAGSKRDFYDSKILGDIDEEKQVEGSGGSTDTLTERPHTVTKRRGWRKKLGLEHGEEEEQELKKLPTTLAESMASDFSDQPGDGWPLGIITLEDILEELLAEEVYDETDADGLGDFRNLSPPPSPSAKAVRAAAAVSSNVKTSDAVASPPQRAKTLPAVGTNDVQNEKSPAPAPAKKTMLARLGMERKSTARDSAALVAEPQRMEPTRSADQQPLSSSTAVEADDYLAAQPLPPAASFSSAESPSRDSRARRSNSVPAPQAGTILSSLPALAGLNARSRPTTPGARPLVIRTQPADGSQPTTSIISEAQLIRGRQNSRSRGGTPGASSSTPHAQFGAAVATTPGVAVGIGGGAGHARGSSSSAARGQRFKSTPVNAGSTAAAALQRGSKPPADASASADAAEDEASMPNLQLDTVERDSDSDQNQDDVGNKPAS